MMVQRALLLLSFVAVLAGCASGPQMKDTNVMPLGQGVMVARLAIPYVAQPGHLKTTISVGHLIDDADVAPPIELTSGETFIVLPLPAGTYRWKDFHIGSYNADLGGAPMHFDIEAGKINYVGDITIVMAPRADPNAGRPGFAGYVPGTMPVYKVSTRVYDYREVFLPKLAAIYPQLWANYPVVVSLTTHADFRYFRSKTP
jgi:hypothetical protein